MNRSVSEITLANFLREDFLENPYPIYRKLRDEVFRTLDRRCYSSTLPITHVYGGIHEGIHSTSTGTVNVLG